MATNRQTLEDWVDSILDEYEAKEWTLNDWREHVRRFPLPAIIDYNQLDFNPKVLQDAMVWLYDGGLRPREVAAVLHVPDNGIGKVLERLAREYEDDEDDAGATPVSS